MTNVKRPIHLQLRPAAAAVAPPNSLSCHRRFGGHQSSIATLSPGGGSPLDTQISNFSQSLTTPTQTAALPQQNLYGSGTGKQALSPTVVDSLPSQILPHLFVGAQEQTNRETVNKLNIKYILSLGLLPLVLQQPQTPTSPQPTQQLSSSQQHSSNTNTNSNSNSMPLQNCSKDYKIRIRSNTTSSGSSTQQQQQQLSNNQPINGLLPSSGLHNGSLQEIAVLNCKKVSIRGDNENKGVKQLRSVYCKCINVADNSDQMLMKFFDEAHLFIEEAIRKRCNILIHCLAGISRSPTIAIAYLMRVKAMHWKDAYELVKQCRPQIDPNLSFMGQLRIYNKCLHNSRNSNDSTNGKSQLCASDNNMVATKQHEIINSKKTIENHLPQQQHNTASTTTNITQTNHFHPPHHHQHQLN